MTTKEAILALVDGKKIRQESWDSGQFMVFKDNTLMDSDGIFFKGLTMSLTDDWEIYEEPKQTVIIEKWLIKSNFDFSFHQVVQTDSIDKLCYCCDCTKVKLLDTYEVEL